MSGVGYRIFPDYVSYEDTVDRRRVRVKATTTLPGAGVPIYFKLIDLDDPSYSGAPVDDESRELDNRGPATLASEYAVTDASGQAAVELTVSWSARDNYVVVASTDEAYVDSLRNVDANGDGLAVYPYIGTQRGPAVAVPQVAAVLQNWRTLNVEIDSMGAEPAGTAFDADDKLRGDIADPLLDLANDPKMFAAAGVKVVRLNQHSSGTIPWRESFEKVLSTGDGKSAEEFFVGNQGHRQGRTKEGFVTTYIAGIYEYGNDLLGEDNDDPNGTTDAELGTIAYTWGQPAGWYSIINEEVLDDLAREHGWNAAAVKLVRQIATVHELGHWFRLDHTGGNDPKDIMWVPPDARFEDKLREIKAVFSKDHIAFIDGQMDLHLGNI